MSSAENPPGRFWGAMEWLGFSLLALMAFAVPLAVVPPSLFPDFQTDRPWTTEGKYVVLQALAGAAIIVGGICFVGPPGRRYRGGVLLPSLLLVGFLGWGAIAVYTTPEPRYSLTYWMPQCFAIAAALLGPLFLHDQRKARWLLVAICAAGLIVALIGVTGALGYRGANRFIYGYDPRDALESVKKTVTVQGGGMRSGSISTMGNPEYAGGYTATIAAIFAVFLLDWVGARKTRRGLARLLLLMPLGFLLLYLALTGTRQPWIALAMAALLRLLLELGIPRKLAAAGFCAQLLVTMTLGVIPGAALFALQLLLLLVYTLRTGTLQRTLRSADRHLVWLGAGLPAALALLLVAFSTPGPWNPGGLRILQRFASATSGTEESFSQRSLMYSVASEMIWEHPLFGVGPGYYFSRFYPTIAGLEQQDDTGTLYIIRTKLGGRIAEQAHNDYLQTAAEQGIVALVLLLSALLVLLDRLVRIVDHESGPRRLLALAFLACLVTFLGIMFTSFPLQLPERLTVFWIIVGGSLGLIAGTPSPREQAP